MGQFLPVTMKVDNLTSEQLLKLNQMGINITSPNESYLTLPSNWKNSKINPTLKTFLNGLFLIQKTKFEF